MIRLLPSVSFLVVTTPSRVAYETVSKLLKLLKRLDVPVLGIVENMTMRPSSYIMEQVEREGEVYLGGIEHDHEIEDAIGDIGKLSSTRFYSTVSTIASILE
jgi:Mrp family chromosome partitioning ATPase